MAVGGWRCGWGVEVCRVAPGAATAAAATAATASDAATGPVCQCDTPLPPPPDRQSPPPSMPPPTPPRHTHLFGLRGVAPVHTLQELGQRAGVLWGVMAAACVLVNNKLRCMCGVVGFAESGQSSRRCGGWGRRGDGSIPKGLAHGAMNNGLTHATPARACARAHARKTVAHPYTHVHRAQPHIPGTRPLLLPFTPAPPPPPPAPRPPPYLCE